MSSPGFSADPFEHSNANLRASSADRDELARILSVAYADGKLDDDEYRERLDSALVIKALGEARTLLIDLGTPAELCRRRPTTGEITAAVEQLRQRRRKLIMGNALGWAGLALLFNIIWVATVLGSGHIGYYWPMWPILCVGIGAVSTAITGHRGLKRKEEQILLGFEPRAVRGDPTRGL